MSLYNLNADMAEGFGLWRMGDDAGLLEIVQSANIACGFHGGDYNIMRRVMAEAKAKGVSIGAHPSFYDLHGFGRRELHLASEEIESLIAYQLGAAIAMASLVGAEVSHVKPHGSLNNMACADYDLSVAIVRGIKVASPQQILLAPAKSEMVRAAHDNKLQVIEEIFADRAYMPDGQLAPRNRPDAMIEDPKLALERCISMLGEGKIKAVDGSEIAMQGKSICVHGDEPTALALAKHLKEGLEAAGFKPATLPQIANSA